MKKSIKKLNIPKSQILEQSKLGKLKGGDYYSDYDSRKDILIE